MPAFFRSPLAGDLRADFKRVYGALQEGRPGPALGLFDNLLRGPYRLEPIELPDRCTLARRVCCGCGRSLGYSIWAEDKAHPDEPYTETGTICRGCSIKAEREIEARYATEERTA